jgi:hypothetical protein
MRIVPVKQSRPNDSKCKPFAFDYLQYSSKGAALAGTPLRFHMHFTPTSAS